MPPPGATDTPLPLIFCLVGVGVSLYGLSQRGFPGQRRSRVVWVSFEIGVLGGLVFWLVVRWLGLGAATTFAPWALGQAAVRAAIWAVVAWPLTAWRLERALGLPHHQSYDVTTLICGVMLVLFLIISSIAVLISHL